MKVGISSDVGTAVAWLSSVRSVRSALKRDNERNLCPVLYLSRETARALRGRKEKQTLSQHDAYALGDTHVTMNQTKGSKAVTWSKSHKLVLSGD